MASEITRDRFTETLWASSIPMIVTIESGKVIEASEAFLRLVDRPRDQVIGKTTIELGLYASAEERDVLVARLRREGKILDHSLRIKTHTGKQRQLLTSIERITAHSVEFLFGVFTDVTERCELESQLRHSQKMESLGLLAGGVAHDFNNVLAVIASNAEMLRDSIPLEHPDHELVDEIEAAVHRAVGLTRQLLAFSRKQVVKPVVLDLNAVVGDTRKMLSRLLGEDVELVTSLEPELDHVRIDPGHLTQIVMNLAVNARDAMAHGGVLSIETRGIRGEARRSVVLSISDTGTGIPPDVIGRIFEPFFTTKEMGKGTGMGLAVVHGIVEQAGGTIEVESTPGTGTTFRIELPGIDAPVERAAPTKSRKGVGAETLIIVDDDQHVLRATARGLRGLGYTVHEASDAAGALELIAAWPETQALITDVVMPGLDGRELAEAACARNPRLRVLFMSGYTDDEILRRGVQQGQLELIEKPFTVQVLAARLRKLLEA